MSKDSDDQTSHSPGPQFEGPAGHNVPTSKIGKRWQSSEVTVTQNPATKAPTGATLPEEAIAGRDHQTRSKISYSSMSRTLR